MPGIMKRKITLIIFYFFSTLLLIAQQDSVNSNQGTFTDERDFQVYNWVKIGHQTWMAENLNHATYEGSKCYDNDAANCGLYGRLYDWYTAMDACPFGWHLPSHSEWSTLADNLGGESIAGGYLKETGTRHWHKPNKAATNETGFTALPGGFRSPAGDYGSMGYYGYFWSSSEKNGAEAWRNSLYCGSDGLDSSFENKDQGQSVRCIKD